MQLNLKNIAADGLVELVIKNTRYFMLLCNTGSDMTQIKVAEQYIDEIINELQSREGYGDLIENKPIDRSRFRSSISKEPGKVLVPETL